MSISAHFSVTTAAVLVLGGIAALVLATVIAVGASHRAAGRSAPVDSSLAAPRSSAPPHPAASTNGAPLETEVEYQLDTSD